MSLRLLYQKFHYSLCVLNLKICASVSNECESNATGYDRIPEELITIKHLSLTVILHLNEWSAYKLLMQVPFPGSLLSSCGIVTAAAGIRLFQMCFMECLTDLSKITIDFS